MNLKIKTILIAGFILILLGSILIASLPIINKYSFTNKNSEFMNFIQKPEVRNEIRANITSYFGGSIRNYTAQELFQWENYYLDSVDTMPSNRPSDPREILKNGIGKCQEFAYLFASACVATGKGVNLIVCAKSDFSEFPHAWNQIPINGFWVNVDSSLSKVNSVDYYRNHDWYWWKDLGEDYLIFSFDLFGKFEDITGEFVFT